MKKRDKECSAMSVYLASHSFDLKPYSHVSESMPLFWDFYVVFQLGNHQVINFCPLSETNYEAYKSKREIFKWLKFFSKN